MSHRRSQRAQVSIVIVFDATADKDMRCIESMLAQSCRELQVLLVQTDTSLAPVFARYVEHDIRVDIVEASKLSMAEAIELALEQAYGDYCMILNQHAWFAPHELQAMLDKVHEYQGDMLIPARSLDIEATGDIHSRVLLPQSQVYSKQQAFLAASISLIAEGVLQGIRGTLLRTSRIQEAMQARTSSMSKPQDAFEGLLYLLPYVQCAVVAGDISYHERLLDPAARPAQPHCFELVEQHHRELLQFVCQWNLVQDRSCLEAVHRLHLQHIIQCIDNMCLGKGRVSSLERRHRVQEIIDAPSTQQSIELLHASSKDFGLMFTPIARRSSAACYARARLQYMFSKLFASLPFGHVCIS
ncbi:glycosyltransferase [Collinsella sp. zg1085]|uniref:glycosyltransferase n=1 Tax=Collinsella sp. zg1085 TaxID=2844380 RepID=UPI001C0ACF3A|nr:glycosyltransferase [Collinsella sp. zg1085]QWT17309.1 glycosyltransferase [Collinsella sp. zg1085]